MNKSFEFFHRQLSRATVVVMAIGLSLLGLALLFALLGFPQAVVSFRGAALSVAYVFAVMFALFLTSTVVAGFLKWGDKRHPAVSQV